MQISIGLSAHFIGVSIGLGVRKCELTISHSLNNVQQSLQKFCLILIFSIFLPLYGIFLNQCWVVKCFSTLVKLSVGGNSRSVHNAQRYRLSDPFNVFKSPKAHTMDRCCEKIPN